MIRLLVIIFATAGAIALLDLLGRRIARRGECVLHRALLLPDTCQGRCPGGQRCVALSTRPHWLFGRQAAACGCMDPRLGGTETTPPSFAEIPRDGEPNAPEPGASPEREDA